MENDNVLRELVKSRKILKRKFDSVKLGEAETYNQLENTFKPLTEPLKKLVKISNENLLRPPTTTLKHDKTKMENIKNTSIIPSESVFKEENLLNASLITSKMDKSNKYSTDEDDDEVNNESFYSQSSNWDFDLTNLNENKNLDTVFGPHKNDSGDWKFGNSDLKISNDKIIVANKSWALTPGLYSLLFHQNPEQYDSSELEIYKQILLETNAHRRNHDPNNQLKGNRGYKYKKVIKKLFPTTTHIGKGLMNINLNKPNYIYWDNPNEIVDRLRLLIASQHAGNNNHTNEIISIIEELREANIID